MGGIRIKKINQKLKDLEPNEYYQKFIKNGEFLSVQFFCKNNSASILSVCEQLMSKRTKNPFLIESLITKKVTFGFFKRLKIIVNRVSKIFKLNGLNNLDFIRIKKKIYIIELNPRPGLGINIVSKLRKNFFNFENNAFKNYSNEFHFSTTILYARKKILIDKKKLKFIKKLDLTNKFSELPDLNDRIMLDAPICLIHLKSRERDLLDEKIKKISYKVLNHLEKNQS